MAETISSLMVVEPVTLTGHYVQLEPMLPAHRDFFVDVGLDEELWRWIPDPVRTPEEMSAYVDAALAQEASGVSLPFTIVERASGKVIGSTRYANIERVHRRIEIGWTWVATLWQRTPVNTECKYLLLRHAFEVLGCIRVELKTDSLNEKSRKAIARIGAREEGIFRNHMITSTGRIRHSVYFSVIDSEWPAVKARLEEKLKSR
ncbi:MAG TPA: GNAT family protein [Candidatus Acidoferrales bacterium]|nr:GNAT family protein [Candidatus Acidoferrales bacterium]